jgi:hypothetical protein
MRKFSFIQMVLLCHLTGVFLDTYMCKVGEGPGPRAQGPAPLTAVLLCNGIAFICYTAVVVCLVQVRLPAIDKNEVGSKRALMKACGE